VRVKPASIFLFVGSSLLLTASVLPKPANLCCQVGETIIFSFVTKAGKTAALCRGPKGAYLVYRFGTAAKLELQYPAKLDAGSWRKFTYWFYTRGGGAQNSGIEDYRLTFENNGAQYTLSDQTTAYYNKQQEEDYRREVAIEVSVNGKDVSIAGNPETVVGELVAVTHDHKVKLDEDMMVAPY
jgi:uncharacterized protein YqkB